ncbi:hypothetical protein APICC_04062 [Apis cerana cerana]|uniref:Uncharacterized protein n=1 Tax=Apis cerana cerana TaxID=94128 RepID=A0A2A3E8T9_APICC|nr:hypothetical protein APICC_04062 [Apis cerana cerana]
MSLQAQAQAQRSARYSPQETIKKRIDTVVAKISPSSYPRCIKTYLIPTISINSWQTAIKRFEYTGLNDAISCINSIWKETRCLASSLSVEIFICGEIDCESDCVIVQTRQEGGDIPGTNLKRNEITNFEMPTEKRLLRIGDSPMQTFISNHSYDRGLA